MNYQEMWNEDNTQVMERYDLAVGRILEIPGENRVQEPFRSYFAEMSRFVGQIEELARLRLRDELDSWSLEELQRLNGRLFADILPDHYEESYGNPEYAARMLGAEFGPMLSAFYAQLRGAIVFAWECRLTDITILLETLLEIYGEFAQEDVKQPEPRAVKQILYWFFSDYTDVTLTFRIREQLDPQLSFARDIIMESDLSDLRYLYQFGEYISAGELQTAAYLNSLPQETIDRMAASYTEGYRKGFEVMRRDLSKKKTAAIRYELGFERMIRAAIGMFEEMGLQVILYRAPVWLTTKPSGRGAGYHGSSPNRQYDYDHRYDQALFFDKAFKERKLAVLRTAYETYKKEASWYAGPAVVETFGEDGFQPVNKEAALALSDKQQELTIAYASESMPVINQYIPGDETSFTIIAFPVPAIGADFPEIFAETIRINTLDYERYKEIQQNIIDVLDQAEYVTVTGRGGNETNLRVSLHRLENPAAQTNFENCVADVNIPLGEVFTSPVLKGTDGLLHVGSVYIGEFCFKDLRIWFKDGMVKEYSCANFAVPEEGRELVRQQILKNHDTLAMGEFAIGTNTVAYAMARRFGILEKLPILIAEKMGPHFAVGDTCYSWSEDAAVYNPDGKEIIARDNEVSLLRREDVSKAYFGCHTDITIPYSELGDITAVCGDGRQLPVIRGGRFAVSGTEELNQELGTE
ncbi:MAG: aminopeptidase [Eubacteriales bacterium]|nr:aminopeptidase [Eubacteriales bacterium]